MAFLVSAIAIPLGWVFAEPLAHFLVPGASQLAGENVALYLLLVPVAALASQPFLQLRPVFEALRQPALAVRVAIVKSLVLGIPLAVAGYFAGPPLGLDPLMGILIGSTVSQVLASLLTLSTTNKLLRSTASPESGP